MGRVQNAVTRILDPAMRHIEVSGTNQASLESNADYHVEPLGKRCRDTWRTCR